jgi:hypothetical protein
MSEAVDMKFTEGDNDQFLVTLTNSAGAPIDLVGSDFFRLRLDRPTSANLILAGTANDLPNGKFDVIFNNVTHLEIGDRQPAQIEWSIGGVVLTSEKFFISVKRKVPV